MWQNKLNFVAYGSFNNVIYDNNNGTPEILPTQFITGCEAHTDPFRFFIFIMFINVKINISVFV